MTTEKEDSIKDKIKSTFTAADNENPDTTSPEKISNNAKVVVLGLFCLVGFLVLLFAITTLLQKNAQPNELFVQVFTAAVTGSFTLGGVLIQQLWGK